MCSSYYVSATLYVATHSSSFSSTSSSSSSKISSISEHTYAKRLRTCSHIHFSNFS